MSDEIALSGQFGRQVAELDLALSFFQRMGDTGLFPDGIKSAADALMVAAAGKRFGFDPLESLQKFHVVKGRVSPSSDLRAGIMLRSPLCLYLRCASGAESCTYTTARKTDPDHEVSYTYTKQDAETAGLWGRGTWAKHPKAMLRARCVSIISRMVFPDLFAGMYDADEIENFNTRAPQKPRPQQRAPEPVEDVQDAVFVEDARLEAAPPESKEPKPKKPYMAEIEFTQWCKTAGLLVSVVKDWRTEVGKGGEFNAYRYGAIVENLKRSDDYRRELTEWVPVGGAKELAMVNALTDGKSGAWLQERAERTGDDFADPAVAHQALKDDYFGAGK
ncbi:MAG: hypothetical protein COA38_20435 [Fluviicola sp.]|nr:MAG: hypothetical protein COA38_20435 [Fluviicola sp.]